MSASFKHVDPKLHGLVEADSSARIQMIEKDLFIEHDMSRFLNSQLDALMAEPRHSRMPCLLITGDAGMGKTAQLRRFQRRYPDGCGAGNTERRRPIVIADTPPEPTRATLELSLLEALEAPGFARGRATDRLSLIRRLLTAHKTRGLIFDEIQHLCHSRSRDRAVVLDTVKALSTTCQMTVICAGTPAVVTDFHADPQLERRFSITQLEKWKPGAALDRFLATYERARPLRRPSRLNTPTLVAALLAETGGTTHSIMQALNSAAIVAIHDGIEHITPELLTVQRTDPARLLRAKLSARTAAAAASINEESEERAEVAA